MDYETYRRIKLVVMAVMAIWWLYIVTFKDTGG